MTRKMASYSTSNHHYRPHPWDGGRYCFQFVSSHLDWGGGCRSGQGVPPSQVRTLGVPPSQVRMWGGGGYLHLGSGWGRGYLIPGQNGGTPIRSGQGVTHPRVKAGGRYPIPGQDGGTPPHWQDGDPLSAG